MPDPNKIDTDKTPAISDKTKELREDWNKLSPSDQERFINNTSAENQDQFFKSMGWYESKAPIGVSAPPKTGSIPWMKEKAYGILNWGANQLPTVGGVAGAVGGGILGGVADPLGGEVSGAIIGSGFGGGLGEAARQGIEHWEGRDKYEDPEEKSFGNRLSKVTNEAAGQTAAEVLGQGAGKMLRPTLERSLGKLYYSGGLKYGDPTGPGQLESVIQDILDTEKWNKANTVGDFLDVIKKTKDDIGQKVDTQMAIPIQQGGNNVMLGNAHANSVPVVNAINSLATSDPSIVKMAKLQPAGKEAAYLKKVSDEALLFSKHPWTYIELTDRRIKLNNELAPLYELNPGERRVYLLDHPELAVKKAEAEAIRDVIYPQMDIAAGNPIGTTAELQTKRGALMNLENQVNDHLSDLKTKARQKQGSPLLEKGNISTYGTSGSGRPGIAVHRLKEMIHASNPERSADRQVSKAFGNAGGVKVRKFFSSPLRTDLPIKGDPKMLRERLSNEFLSMPLRELVNPKQRKGSDKDSIGPQSSVQTPKALLERAKRLNPAPQEQVAYAHHAFNPDTGHHVASHDGRSWYDVRSGQQIA